MRIHKHPSPVWFLCLLPLLYTDFSCTTANKGLFGKRTPHEAYADKLSSAGLKETVMGNKWFAAADKGLQQPLQIKLPYKESGYFSDEAPNAAGYIFGARRGEKIQITISTVPATFLLFADVWQQAANGDMKCQSPADTAGYNFSIEAENDGQYKLRLQPQLLAAGAYTLTVTTAPSLAFPVPAGAHPNIGSFWGASRDAGARKHEGIDIFGKFRTPVVAAANGYISGTRQNNLGGKVVFLRPDNKNYTLYYAHLDSQLVQEGQRVLAGEAVGLMGNTGNAKNTPTHLHFGIYTDGGAVDPLPFVNTVMREPESITAPAALLNNNARTSRRANLYTTADIKAAIAAALPANTLLKVIAATGNWYKVQMPGLNKEGFVPEQDVTALSKPLEKIKLKAAKPLFDMPDTAAAVKTVIANNTEVNILAASNNFFYLEKAGVHGWISK